MDVLLLILFASSSLGFSFLAYHVILMFFPSPPIAGWLAIISGVCIGGVIFEKVSENIRKKESAAREALEREQRREQEERKQRQEREQRRAQEEHKQRQERERQNEEARWRRQREQDHRTVKERWRQQEQKRQNEWQLRREQMSAQNRARSEWLRQKFGCGGGNDRRAQEESCARQDWESAKTAMAAEEARREQEERMRQEQERRAQEERMRQEQKRRALEERKRQDMFLRYLFSILAKMAKADGKVEAEEVKIAESVFDRFDFAARRRTFCAETFNSAKDNSRSVYWYAEQLGNLVSDDAVCVFVYELLWDVACADGWLHPGEKEILLEICKYLRIPEAYFEINFRRRSKTFTEGDKRRFSKQDNQQRTTTDNDDSQQKSQQTTDFRQAKANQRKPYVSGRSSILEAYALLECEPSATAKDLKSAYHSAAKRYHPDTLRANGVPEEMISFANERMAEINAAWEDIRQSRGIK